MNLLRKWRQGLKDWVHVWWDRKKENNHGRQESITFMPKVISASAKKADKLQAAGKCGKALATKKPIQGIWTNLIVHCKTTAFSVNSWNSSKLSFGILTVSVLSSCWLRILFLNLFKLVPLAPTDPLLIVGLGRGWTTYLLCPHDYDEIPTSLYMPPALHSPFPKNILGQLFH